VDCARRSLRAGANRNFAARVSVAEVDLAAPEQARIEAGLGREAAAAVLVNPPFHIAGAVRASPAAARASAHVLELGLDDWLRAAAWALRPGGEIIVVSLAAAIADILAALAGRFGGAALLPLHSRPGRPAERLLLRAVKGSRAAPSILPGLTLHGATGPAFTAEMDRVLRDGAGLAEIHAPWQRASGSPS
jgi:tRNA1(Val) A37 N6-methylase TrmN6